MNALDLSQAVFIQNQQIKTDSLKVADAFGKRHTHVLRAIESLDCSKEFNEPNFGLVEYIDAKGESRPMYEMTKDGWMFLVMGCMFKSTLKFRQSRTNGKPTYFKFGRST